MLNISYTLILIFTSIFFIFINNKKNKKRIILSLLYFYHLFFAYIYYKMSLSNNADSIQYYFNVKDNLENYNFYFTYGTNFIQNLTYILIKYLDMSYFNTTLVFATIGYFGFYLLFSIFHTERIKYSKYLIFIFFLPNIHFWTVAIGKDSFIFFALSLLVYSLYKKDVSAKILSIFLVFLVRPHIAFLIITTLGLESLFFSKLKLYKKIVIISILGIIIMNIMPIILDYVGLHSTNYEAIGNYIEQRQGYNTSGGSSVNIKDYNFFMKMFTYLYRPLFESFNPLVLIVSIENLVYLYMTYYIVKNRKHIKRNSLTVFGVIFIFLFTILMSNTTANLGIAIRQKTMMIPFFFYLYANIFINKRLKKYAK